MHVHVAVINSASNGQAMPPQAKTVAICTGFSSNLLTAMIRFLSNDIEHSDVLLNKCNIAMYIGRLVTPSKCTVEVQTVQIIAYPEGLFDS